MPYISIFHYFFLGVQCFMCMYMAVSFILFRRKDNLYFFLFLFFSFLNFYALNHKLFNISTTEFENSKLLKILFNPIAALVAGFYYLFVIQFLEFEKTNKILYYFLYLNVVINMIVGLVFSIMEFFEIEYFKYFISLAILGYAASFLNIIFLYKSTLRYSKIILLGAFTTTVGSSIGLISIVIYGKTPPIEIHFFSEIGILIDMFVYSIAINIKWNDSEKFLLQEYIERSIVVSNERQRIASEMHDELGGNLTSLMYLAHNLKDKTSKNDQVDKIIQTSSGISESINEIVWALNQEQNQLADWVLFVRGKTAEMFENASLQYAIHSPANIPERILSNLEKRNLYLVVKEAVNNAIKHSKASQYEVNMNFENGIHILVQDNGQGFIENGTPKTGGGNGLKNMKRRMEEIGGTIAWSNGEGTKVKVSLL
ncbi:MAG: ATP-binding protein [Leadbetterella sp.]